MYETAGVQIAPTATTDTQERQKRPRALTFTTHPLTAPPATRQSDGLGRCRCGAAGPRQVTLPLGSHKTSRDTHDPIVHKPVRYTTRLTKCHTATRSPRLAR